MAAYRAITAEERRSKTVRIGRQHKTVGWTGGKVMKSGLCLCSDCIRQCPDRAALVRPSKSFAYAGGHYDSRTGKRVGRKL